MSERALAIVVSNDNLNVTSLETVDAILKADFKNVFIQWYNKDFLFTQEEQLDYINVSKLNVIFAHLGYQNINDLWVEGLNGDKLVERYQNDIKICKDNNIEMVVIHLTSKTIAPAYGEIGLNRIQQIADYAQELGVKIAFENTKTPGYLEYVINHIKNENVGICFDSGHYHCHFKDELDFSVFKDRIFAVHLHDNDMASDQHLIPFDGTINWEDVVNKLKQANYEGPITLEACYGKTYQDLSLNEFYKKCYQAALKIQKLFD